MKTYCYLLMVILIILVGCSQRPTKPQTTAQTDPKTESSSPPNQPEEVDNKDYPHKNLVVWADDSSELAVVIQNQSGDQTDLTTPQHQIWVQHQDGSERRAITDWRNYQAQQIFYMKQAGYFVVESLLEKGARRFDKIALNGNEILIIETPDREHQPCRQSQAPNSAQSLPSQVEQTVIPSPDGQRLAHIYSPECGKVTVEFLYANSLNIFDNQTMTIDEAMKATWHREGYIILTNHNNDKAWKVIPAAPPLPVLPPKCLSPVTTSSDLSLEGQKVYFEGDTLMTKAVGRDKAFGCQ
jgi:hypothetical protein